MKNNQKKTDYREGEIWKPIKEYADGFPYEISNFGRVRNANNHGLMSFEQGKGRGTRDNKEGYYSVRLWNFNTNKRKWFLLHRLIAEAFIENPNNYPCVNHKDGIKSNNNIENLEWCTYLYNNVHARNMNLNTSSFPAKISRDERKTVEKLYSQGMSVANIARKYDVTPDCIYNMKARKQIELKRDVV